MGREAKVIWMLGKQRGTRLLYILLGIVDDAPRWAFTE